MLMGPCKKATTNTNIDLVSACRSCFISNDTLIDGDDTYLAFMRKTKRSFWSTAAAKIQKRDKKMFCTRAYTKCVYRCGKMHRNQSTCDGDCINCSQSTQQLAMPKQRYLLKNLQGASKIPLFNAYAIARKKAHTVAFCCGFVHMIRIYARSLKSFVHMNIRLLLIQSQTFDKCYLMRQNGQINSKFYFK